MIYKLRRITYTIWAYLNQSVIPSEREYSVWKFKRFCYLYQIQILENCWDKVTLEATHDNCGEDEYQAEN